MGAMALGLAACGESINPFSKDVIDVGCPAIGALKEAEAADPVPRWPWP